MFGSLGPTEILLIVLALVLLFGGKKIPELAKGIGGGIKEFKKSLNSIDDDLSLEKSNSKKGD
jgi:sec-independent protein translocase protein TatA